MSRLDHHSNSEHDAGVWEQFHSSNAYDPREDWPDPADVTDYPTRDPEGTPNDAA